jgi:hypothetical protein
MFHLPDDPHGGAPFGRWRACPGMTPLFVFLYETAMRNDCRRNGRRIPFTVIYGRSQSVSSQ